MASEESGKKTGSIVLMDVLGTKDRWNTKNKQKVFEEWEQFLDLIENGKEEITKVKKSVMNPRVCDMNVHSFSDTILLTFPIEFVVKNEQDSVMAEQARTNLEFACDIATSILGLGIAVGLPFRGCISFGEFFESHRTVTGDAIIDAAQYYEQANWIGVSFSPSACKIVQKIPFSTIERYDIPLKIGIEKNGFALNILSGYNRFQEQESSLKTSNPNCASLIDKMNLIDGLTKILEKMHFEKNDIASVLKIKNTLAFIEHIKKKYPKHNS